MRKLRVVLAVLGVAAPALAKSGAGPVSLDQLQKAVGDKVATCMNEADDGCFGSLWTADGRMINPEAVSADGKEAVVKSFHQDWATFAKGTTSTVKIDSFKQVKPDVLFVDATHHIVGAHGVDGKALPPLDFHLALLLVKQKGQWLTQEVRSYMFQPPPAAAKTADAAPMAK